MSRIRYDIPWSGFKTFDDPRFWRLTRPGPNGCILWSGYTNHKGYGVVHRNGKTWQAHRYSYTRKYGSITDGMFVCHRCDVPACVNPRHLFLGTQRDNTDDMLRKGRQAVNESASRCELSAADVRDIRALAVDGANRSALAREYGVNRRTVLRIIKGERRSYA